MAQSAVDIKDVIVAVSDKESNENIGIIRRAEAISCRRQKRECFFVCKSEGNSECYCSGFAGVVTFSRDLAEESAIHINAGIYRSIIDIQASDVMPENIVEAILFVNEGMIETTRSGRYCFAGV